MNECVQSILDQDADVQIVLYADHPDCSMDVNDSRVTVIRDGERRGQVARINAGVRLLDTDYVSFMGVDDYLAPYALLLMAKKMEDTGCNIWYYGGHKQLDISTGIVKEWPAKAFDLKRLQEKMYIASGAAFIRRDMMCSMMLYTVAGLGADRILLYRIGFSFDPVVMDFPVYVERIGTGRVRRRGIVRVQRMLINLYLRWWTWAETR